MEVPLFGQRFFVRHICHGVVSYPELNKVLLLREEVLRKMDPKMSGVPVVYNTEHLTQAEGEEIAKADRKGGLVEGVVVKSFFNEMDGWHWCEFMAWDENVLAAIKAGIGVSNAYFITSKAPAGEFNATAYDIEVMDAVYDHLLITAKPRYEDSQAPGILTPEEFKQYNEQRKEKLALVTNQKESTVELFKIFNRQPAEIKLDGVEAFLPKSKKTVLITQILNEKDEEMKKEEDGEQMANMDHKVKVGNSTKSLHELMDCYNKVMRENEALKTENAEWKEAAGEKAENSEESEEEKKERLKNEKEKEDKEKAENAEKEKTENQKREAIRIKNEKLRRGPSREEAIKNSRSLNDDSPYEQPVIRFKEDAVAAGLEKYGKVD